MLNGLAYNHIPQRLSVPIIFFFSSHNLIRLSSMDFLWRSGKLVVIEMKNMRATNLHITMFHYEMLKLKKFFNPCFLLFEFLLLLRQKPSLTFLFILGMSVGICEKEVLSSLIICHYWDTWLGKCLVSSDKPIATIQNLTK